MQALSWDGEANTTRLRESRILTGVVAVAQFLHRNSCKVALESDVIFNVMSATCASDEGYGRQRCAGRMTVLKVADCHQL